MMIRLIIVLQAVVATSALAAQRWSDDFRTVHHLRAIEGVVQRRAYGRIVTRPDVRINSPDPASFVSSVDGRSLAYGYFPAIHRLRSGVLLCAHREGIEHGMTNHEARAVVDRSFDGGRTWQTGTVILQKPGWGVSPMQMFQLRDSSVWLHIRMRKVAGDDKGKWKRAIMRSTDDGGTWQQIGDRRGLMACEMSNGELLWLDGSSPIEDPLQTSSWSNVRATRTSRWVDGKIVWSRTRSHPELGPTSDEWMVAETDRPGELVSMMRQQQHSHYYATAKSYDYGHTWTQWRDSNVYLGPVPCRPSIRSMGDGRLIFTYGQRWIGRTFAVVSYDHGETWDVANRQVILHSPDEYHRGYDSHYTDVARAEGGLWLAIDYIANPRNNPPQRGIYGTFIDERFFKKVFAGLQLRQTAGPWFARSVGLWGFDELDDDFSRDPINGNYGEIRGAQRTVGHLGGALQFDGKDDHVLVWDDASLRVPRFFGVSAWINTRDPSKEQTIVSKAPAYTLIVTDGVPKLEIGMGFATADLAEPLKADQWYQVGVTYSMRANYTRVTFYVNGREISHMRLAKAGGGSYIAQTYPEGIAQTDRKVAGTDPRFQEFGSRRVTSEECLVIGMDNNLETRPFDGMIDEVLLHDGPFRPSFAKAAYERAFVKSGSITSRPIERPEDAQWTTFEAKVTQPEGTEVRFELLDGHEERIRRDLAPGESLSDVDATVITLRAELTANTLGQAPILHEWSLGATTAAPRIRVDPIPDQSAVLTGTGVKARLMSRVSGVDQRATRIAPTGGVPLYLWGKPVGTKATVTFDLTHEPANITEAWLELAVDDIDAPAETVITLNGQTRIEITGSLIGESGGRQGALSVPIEALRKGQNTFEFTFADDLNGTTGGYQIDNAALSVLINVELPL